MRKILKNDSEKEVRGQGKIFLILDIGIWFLRYGVISSPVSYHRPAQMIRPRSLRATSYLIRLRTTRLTCRSVVRRTKTETCL
jgi:hypothetical protein